MMLCIQTVLADVDIALLDEVTHVPRWVSSWTSMRDEAARLLPTIQEGLLSLELSADAITQVLAVVGPGSFTAVRVGLSIANTIGYVQQIPLIGVSAFAYLAATTTSPVFVVISASLRDCFIRTPEGEELLLSVEETKERIGTHPWIGRLTQAQQPLFTEHLSYQIQETMTAGERFQLLAQKEHETTSLLVPYYLKGANITERKCR